MTWGLALRAGLWRKDADDDGGAVEWSEGRVVASAGGEGGLEGGKMSAGSGLTDKNSGLLSANEEPKGWEGVTMLSFDS